MLRRTLVVWPILVVSLVAGPGQSVDVVPPRSVKVLPVFFVPKGEKPPTPNQAARLAKHLEWTQARYNELLRGQTFAIAQKKPRVYQSARPLAFYKDQKEQLAPQIVNELLTDLQFNRYNCPYVLLAIIMNSKDGFPTFGGRPLNGGFNTGGGIIVGSSFTLDRSPNLQSTLQHELGHSFGLPHVDVYGYDMKSNDSIMSYNSRHHTNGFRSSPMPGKLIPEDLRGLALNQRVFPELRFDAEKDIPQGYTISERIVTLGPMTIPDQPDGVKVTTESGEEFGSKVANIVQGKILPSRKTGKVTFNPKTMWQSAKSPTGWVSVEISFPYEVELTRIAVHSEHSGQYHPARAVRIAVRDDKERFAAVAESNLASADEAVTLRKTKGQVWRLDFRAGESGVVVLRGLQFFSGDDELFPPLIPYQH